MNARRRPAGAAARGCLVLAALAALAARGSCAAETVILAGAGGAGRTRIAGEVVDFTGQGLVIRMTDGREQRFAADRVVDIELTRAPAHEAAERALAAGDFDAATAGFRAALDNEQRRWVRRLLQQRLIWSYRGQGKLLEAIETFFVLLRGDAQTPYFDAIPLLWTSAAPPAELVQKALTWVTSNETIATRLVGSSVLLETAEAATARAALDVLAKSNDDARVALLVAAQQWRALTAAQAAALDVAKCRATLVDLPDGLQAGPSLALARVYVQRGEAQRAALAALRATVLAGNDRPLAAAALALAGEQLVKLDRPAEAETVYRELATRYRGTPSAAHATEWLAWKNVKDTDRVPPTIEAPQPDDVEERFLAALRGRGLFRLAAAYCNDCLNDSCHSPRGRALLTAGWSRTLAEQARITSPADAASTLWDQAAQVPADFAARNPQHGYLPMVRLQGALVELARGELLMQDASVLNDAALVTEAQQHLRQAIAQFAEIERDAQARASELARAGRSVDEQERLPEFPLRQLTNNVRYQWARALIAQAESYPAGSADRVAAAGRARELLSPLTEMDEGQPLRTDAMLADLVCLRLLDQRDEAVRLATTLEALQLEPTHRAALEIERVRSALAAGEADKAVARADTLTTGALGGAGDLVRLQAYLAMRQANRSDAAAAADWQARAAALVQEIASVDGPAWGERARRMMSSLGRPADAPPGDMAGNLAAKAGSLYRAGKIDQSLAAYDGARQAAVDGDQLDWAFELAFTAATIEHQRKNFAAAAARYRAAALARVEHQRAAEAHLLGIYDLSQDLRARTPIDFTEYQVWLAEHLARWPRAATAPKARDWLAKVHEHAGRWDEALAVYRGVLPDDPAYPQAVEGLARLHLAELAALHADGKPTSDAADAAARALAGRIEREGNRWPTKFSDSDRALALAAARAWVFYGERGAAEAEGLLRASLASKEPAPPQWIAESQAVLSAAVAAQGRAREADDLWRNAGRIAAAEQVQILATTTAAIDRLPQASRGEMAELVLEIAAYLELESQALTDAQRRDVARLAARALAAAGRTDEAAARYAAAVAAFSQDRPLAVEYAEFLAGRGDRAALEKAIEVWHGLERAADNGSDEWLQAKLHQGLLYERLGDRPRVVKLISATQVLHPELGGPTLKAQFLELLARCRAEP